MTRMRENLLVVARALKPREIANNLALGQTWEVAQFGGYQGGRQFKKIIVFKPTPEAFEPAKVRPEMIEEYLAYIRCRLEPNGEFVVVEV